MKNSISLLLFTLGIIIQFNNSYAQVKETYFTDPEPRKGFSRVYSSVEVENGIIFRGSTFDNVLGEPVITRVDTLGNLVWTTTNQNSGGVGNVDNLMFDGEDVFAISSDSLWKVNADNGEIIWTQKLDFYRLPHTPLIDLNDSTLLFAHNHNEYYTQNIEFIDKETGHVNKTLSFTCTQPLPEFCVKVDSLENIYYTVDDTIYKVHSSNLDSVIWKINFPISYMASYKNPSYYNSMHLDNESLYVFGYCIDNSRSFVASININEGVANWAHFVTDRYKQDRDIAVYDTSLFIVWQPTYTDTYFYIQKLNKNTGESLWKSEFQTEGNSEAFSIDVDENGDVFVAGYVYHELLLAAVKLDGTDGNKLFETIVGEVGGTWNSTGAGLYLFNDTPYVIGNAYSTNAKGTMHCLLKLNSSSGDVLRENYYGGTYQFPSKVVDIIKYGKDKVLILKQVGRFVHLEMYDYNLNLLWDKELHLEYMLTAINMAVDENKNILIKTCPANSFGSQPFKPGHCYDISLFKLDSLGNEVFEYTYENSSLLETDPYYPDEIISNIDESVMDI